jgi:hypothetical protein
MSSRREEISLSYAKLAKKLGIYPSRSDLKKVGISRDMVRDHFGGMESLKDFSKETRSKYFDKLIDPDFFDDQVHRDLQAKVKKHKRFIITTAVSGAPVHNGFLESIKMYAHLNKAMILLFPANYALYEMDKELVSDPEINIVFKQLKLNSNLNLDPIKIDPKQVDPAVGLDALGKVDGTVIIGSPKQRRISVANSNEKLARIIQATGAITKPKYVPNDGIPKRRDRLAEEHHVMGAIVVDIVDDELYHFRIVQMRKDGTFNDLFHRYSEDGIEYVGCEAIIQGDYHATETDPLVDSAVDEMCRIGKPKYRVFHDFFSGVSINHHEIKNKVARARLAVENKISLEDELRINAEIIDKKRKQKTAKHLVFVKSNHDEFLDRYLSEGAFDDNNRIISTKLQILAMEGKDPLKSGLETYFNLKPGKDVLWLKRDEDFRIAGVESGAHGDLGSNGRRNPGAKGMYKAYGKVNYGHCHHGEIWHGAMSAGTSSYMRLGYNRGSSSWDNSQIILYDDGTRQLINVIKGNWKLNTKEK